MQRPRGILRWFRRWPLFGLTTGFTWKLASEGDFGPPPIIQILFPLFGIVITIVGVGWSFYAYRKAEEYQDAKANFRSRESNLLNEIAHLKAHL